MSLKISNVSFSFFQENKEIPVLKNLSLEANTGEIVAIVGKSGSGKSTLLSLVAGLEKPRSGSILIGGTDITLLSKNEMTSWRGSNIGIVFQQFHLVPHLTARENLSLPFEIQGQRDNQRVNELLAHLGLSDRSENFPSQLSGGESQRVAIGRALALKPSLLLADEPSGSLDQETGEQVMELFFRELRREKATCLFVTHNLDLASRCDKTFLLTKGELHAAAH